MEPEDRDKIYKNKDWAEVHDKSEQGIHIQSVSNGQIRGPSHETMPKCLT